MGWIKACRGEEIPVGETRSVEVAGEFVLLCRLGEADYHAVADLCSHDDGPLGEGVLEGKIIECPRHGARFDVTTGIVARMPAPAPLVTYPVRLNDGWLEVELEESG